MNLFLHYGIRIHAILVLIIGLSYRLAPPIILASMPWPMGRFILLPNLALIITVLTLFFFPSHCLMVFWFQASVTGLYLFLWAFFPYVVHPFGAFRPHQRFFDDWDALLHIHPLFVITVQLHAENQFPSLKTCPRYGLLFVYLIYVGLLLIHLLVFDRVPYQLECLLIETDPEGPQPSPYLPRYCADKIQAWVKMLDSVRGAPALLRYLELESFVTQRSARVQSTLPLIYGEPAPHGTLQGAASQWGPLSPAGALPPLSQAIGMTSPRHALKPQKAHIDHAKILEEGFPIKNEPLTLQPTAPSSRILDPTRPKDPVLPLDQPILTQPHASAAPPP